MRYFPIFSPALVAGANLRGNDSRVVTERGQTFLLSVLNMLNGSLKVFGDQEPIPGDIQSIWCGMDLETAQDEFQFIQYVGENEENAFDWGDLSRADFDFDGIAESSVYDVIPFDLYNGVDASSDIDYSWIWDEEELRGELSSEHSFWQAMQDGSYPTTPEGNFTFLLYLNHTRRNWIYGMNAIGINPLDPSASDFEAMQETWRYQEVGSLNIQALRQYMALRCPRTAEIEGVETTYFDGIVGRFEKIAADSWFNDVAVPMAMDYYRTRISGVDLSTFETRITNLETYLGGLRGLLDGSGALTGDAATARSFLSTIGSLLSGTAGVLEGLNREFGLLPADLTSLVSEISSLIDDYFSAVPGDISDGTNLSAATTRLDSTIASLNSIFSGYETIIASPESLVNAIFTEFSTPLSTEELSESLSNSVVDYFTKEASKPIGQVVNLMDVNRYFKYLNTKDENREKEKKVKEHEEKRLEKEAEMKRFNKARSLRKAEMVRSQMKAQNNAKANNKKSNKVSASQRNNKTSQAKTKKRG